ncbi:esterase-like activity of phytase family protein [Nocardia sp. NPDC056100]|uniref:esterase-like activity of phytase family protein n=1 Tax=Nocardia sp. NPDC056100 TaxID=3345712 RepID=UPI0035E0CD2E
MNKRALAVGAVVAALSVAAPSGMHLGPGQAFGKPGVTVRLLSSVNVPDDFVFDGQLVGGLSGIDFRPVEQTYLAISDNRGESGPVRAYTLRLPIDKDGKLGTPEFQRQILLKDTDGTPYAPRSIDPESIRWNPNGQSMIYTSEGEAKVGRPGFIREAALDGGFIRDIPVPDAFTPRLDGGQVVSGIRDNLGFEAMDLPQGGSSVVAVSENALAQDGPAASPDAESRARFVGLNSHDGADIAEYIYPVDRVAPGGVPAATGISEILADGADRFLTLERSMIPNVGFTARIYSTSTAGATPVTGAAVAPANATPMSKELLFDFRAAGIDPQCVEGITRGPTVNGQRTLVVVSDNNFGVVGKTMFHLLAVDSGFPGVGTGSAG